VYNRYINPKGFFNMPQRDEPSPPIGPFDTTFSEPFEEVSAEVPLEEDSAATPDSSKGGKGLFGGSFKLPDFNADTILMLVLLYFLISDKLTPSSKEDGEKDKKNITDTMLIIGALLLLGF